MCNIYNVIWKCFNLDGRRHERTHKRMHIHRCNVHTRCLTHRKWALFVSVYLSSLPVVHLSDAPRRRLVVTGYSARIQDKTTERPTWLFNVLGVLHRHTGPRFKVSSDRQLVIVRLTNPGIEHTTSSFQVERS